MARNRKRAKERRRQTHPSVAGARPGPDPISAPDPIAHATPDSELAEAQLALGRPELSEDPQAGFAGSPSDPAQEEHEFEPTGGQGGDDGLRAGRGFDGDGRQAARPGGAGELSTADAPAPAARAPGGNRLIHFLQGSWRELQRVQWPDRRAVMQATGVVLGFVIVAGVYLGVADALAGRIVDFIIK